MILRPAPTSPRLADGVPGLLAAICFVGGSVAPTVSVAQSVSLRPLADAAGVAFGAAVDNEALDDGPYRQLLADHVNLLSTRGDLSMAVVQPEPGVFDFSSAEAIVDFAVENDMTVRGHELIGGAAPRLGERWQLDGGHPRQGAERSRDHGRRALPRPQPGRGHAVGRRRRCRASPTAASSKRSGNR